jgi:hypothetical protein
MSTGPRRRAARAHLQVVVLHAQLHVDLLARGVPRGVRAHAHPRRPEGISQLGHRGRRGARQCPPARKLHPVHQARVLLLLEQELLDAVLAVDDREVRAGNGIFEDPCACLEVRLAAAAFELPADAGGRVPRHVARCVICVDAQQGGARRVPRADRGKPGRRGSVPG